MTKEDAGLAGDGDRVARAELLVDGVSRLRDVLGDVTSLLVETARLMDGAERDGEELDGSVALEALDTLTVHLEAGLVRMCRLIRAALPHLTQVHSKSGNGERA